MVIDKTQDSTCDVQVVNGLTSLLANGSSTNGNLSSLESYNTALSFVQALGRTQDSNGNTTAVTTMTHSLIDEACTSQS